MIFLIWMMIYRSSYYFSDVQKLDLISGIDVLYLIACSNLSSIYNLG